MKNILLGVASSASQIESQDIHSSWHDWANIKGKIIDGSHPKNSTDHYNLYQEDTKLIKELGIGFYRMGIEWASIQPSLGVYNEEVIQHYIDEIKLLKENNIKVMVCFHHFTNPSWFEELNGWLDSNNNKYFIDYVTKMLTYLKGLVDEFLTFNEPSIYAGQSYYLGIWPPEHKSMKDYLKVISNMAVCHITIYKHIKKIYSEKHSLVSFSHSYMLGKGINISGKIVARTYSHFTNKIVLNAFAKGNFSIFLKKDKTIKKGNYIDFWGLNYYAISYFKGMQSVNPKGFPLTDMGWLVYPEGIIQSSNAMLKVVELPIFITENGTCDSSDKFRIRYIYEHLKILSSSKLSIQRYYHWCLVDNFEWNSGLEKQFGLIKVDNITKVRTIKESGRFYSLLNKLELEDKEIQELVDKSQYTKYS